MFIERTGARSFAPPYQAANVRLNGFVLRGNTDEIQRLCDRNLNWPGSRRRTVFRPVSSNVLLTVEQMDVRLPDGVAGILPVREMAVWIPVQHPGGLGLFVSHMYIDSDYGMYTGRDVLGFPKSYVEFDRFAEDYRRPESYEARVFALRRFASDERLGLNSFFKIQHKARRHSDPIPQAKNSEEVAQEIAKLLLGEQLAGSEPAAVVPRVVTRGVIAGRVLGWLARPIPVILLKQHRDAVNPSEACFRRLVTAPAKMDQVRRLGWLPGEYELHFAELESEPLHRLITPQVVEWPRAFCMDFDFSIGSGEYLYGS